MDTQMIDVQIQLIIHIILLIISIISTMAQIWSFILIRPQFSSTPYQFIGALSIYELFQNLANIITFIQSFTNNTYEVVTEINCILTLPTNLSFSFILICLQWNRFLHNSFSNFYNKFFSTTIVKILIFLSTIIFLLRFIICLIPQFSLQYSPNQFISNFSFTQDSTTMAKIETAVHLFFVSILLLFLFIFSLVYIFQENSPLILSRVINPTLVISIIISIYHSSFIIFWQCLILNGGFQVSAIILKFILVFRGFIHSLLIISIPRVRSSSTISLARRPSEDRTTTTSNSNLRIPKDSKENRSGNSNWKKRLTGDLKIANAALTQDKVKYLT